MNDYRDEFLIIQNVPDQWNPIVKHRVPKLVKTGTWFFGLLNTYEIQFSEWKDNV